MTKLSKSKFVRFTNDEFKAALSYVPGKIVAASVPAWEHVYDIHLQILKDISVRIYSSVDKITGYSRDKGSDSIKIILIDDQKQVPISDVEKIFRTNGWSSRMNTKIKELIGYAASKMCPNCNVLMVKREGPHGLFLGCVNYPKCKQTKKYKQD